MTIIRPRRDPRTRDQRRADAQMLARLEQGEVLTVPAARVATAARRVQARNAERRLRVAELGKALASLRRLFGLTQEEVAQAIGTSKPNVCAIERGRAPGLSLERFLAVLETLAARNGNSSGGGFSPTAGFRAPTSCVRRA